MDRNLQQPKTTHNPGQRELREDEIENVHFGRTLTRRGGVKYEVRKHSNVELVPQPSDRPEDPLNWSTTKKNLHFATLLLTAGTLGSLKTLLVTVNGVIATELSVSYGATVALTGVPILFGAGFAFKSRILAQSVGKRGIQLGSALLMLLASVSNMHITGNYAEFMISRIFQGIGWGMFEGLMTDSIADLYFEHERASRNMIYNFVSILFTWGSPILGGYLSQQVQSYSNEIMILNIVQAFGILFLILFAPESTYHRSQPAAFIGPKSNMRAYFHTLKLTGPHSTQGFSTYSALRTLRALATPSALLTTLLSAPVVGTAFGIANSLALLLGAMPIFLFPSRIGYIFILPLVFSLLTFFLSAFLSRKHALPTAISSLIFAAAGLLSFGLYTENSLAMSATTSIFTMASSGGGISLELVSALFGLLVCGAVAVASSTNSYLASSSVDPDIAAAQLVLHEVVVGIWTMATPVWIMGIGMGMNMDTATVAMYIGLRSTSIALAVLGMVMGTTIAAALWIMSGWIQGADERVLGGHRGRSEEGLGKGDSSYFDV